MSYLRLINGLYVITLIIVSSPVLPPQHFPVHTNAEADLVLGIKLPGFTVNRA